MSKKKMNTSIKSLIVLLAICLVIAVAMAAINLITAPKIAEALKAQLAAKANFSVVMDETHGSGFNVKLDGGRVEHDFTGATVAAELAKRLRPDLAALMKESQPSK